MIEVQEELSIPEDSGPCLIVVLGEEIALVLTSEGPRDTFIYKNMCYVDQGYGDLAGFYDWLRNSEKHIIGVRYLPDDELNSLRIAITHLPYVLTHTKQNGIEVYFSDERCFVESFSDDQDFGNNRVYRSETGRFALSFNADRAINSFSAEVARKCRQLE